MELHNHAVWGVEEWLRTGTDRLRSRSDRCKLGCSSICICRWMGNWVSAGKWTVDNGTAEPLKRAGKLLACPFYRKILTDERKEYRIYGKSSQTICTDICTAHIPGICDRFYSSVHRRTVSVLLSVHYRKGRKVYRNRQLSADLYGQYIYKFF